VSEITLADGSDNCQWTFNPEQIDFDGDGMGDACDLDDDNDAVLDGADACPDTALGALINASGCSIADIAPCTPSGGTPWKNHGAYVKAVTQAANAFVASGLITAAQKGAIVSAAAASSCGQ
jgi:Thrombospondin type 3 repeat